MKIIEEIGALRQVRAGMAGAVGMVPTMGALHAGHLSLVKMARQENEYVIATIFVNPTQFGPGEDLDSYPRDLDNDLAAFEEAGVDVVFVPSPDLMYPPGYSTYVYVEGITTILEGEHRPEHFRGVTTIVSKLFNLVQPTRAYFGQKDAQQVVVLRRMVHDLNFAVEVVVGETVRQEDGLAMSSRNAYLNAEERQAAVALSRALQVAGQAYDAGERDPESLRLIAMDVVNSEELIRTNYVAVLKASNLALVDHETEEPLIIVVAAQVGQPRLLDNCLLPLHLNSRDGLTATLGVDFT